MKIDRYHGLDTLRAAAIILVFMFHYYGASHNPVLGFKLARIARDPISHAISAGARRAEEGAHWAFARGAATASSQWRAALKRTARADRGCHLDS